VDAKIGIGGLRASKRDDRGRAPGCQSDKDGQVTVTSENTAHQLSGQPFSVRARHQNVDK